MEAARVYVSLPFRAEGLEEEYPGCLRTFDAREINRFLLALEAEIRSVSADSGDLLVREIILGNGSVAHLTADDLTGIVQMLRLHFHVSPEARIRLSATPSGFDFYKLSAIRQMGNASLRLEFPALTEESLRAGGYRCTVEKAEEVLDCCFQNGFRHFSVFLTAKALEDDAAEKTLKRCLAARPEELMLRADAEEGLFQTADRIMTQSGWTRADHRWVREKLPPPVRCSVQIGCGPNAVSCYDGCAVRSTSDFDFYCDHSDDFEALVRRAESDFAERRE